MNFTNSMKVGIMVFIALFFMAATVFIIGDIQFFNKRYNITVKFTHVDGLLEGAKVTYAGVKVGKVESINIKGGKVFVQASITDKIKVPVSAHFTIDTSGLMGEKYLGIDVDPEDTESVILTDGREVTGTDPMRLSKLLSEGDQIMVKLKGSMDSVHKILSDDKVIDSARGVVINAYEVSLSAKNVMASFEDRIEGIQDNIEELIKNFGDVGRAFSMLIDDNKANIHDLIQNYKDVGGEIYEVINDNKKNVTAMISSFKKTGESLNKILTNIEDNGNTAEKIKEILENFRNTSKNAEKVSESIYNIFKDGTVEAELKSSVKSISKVAKKADSFLSSFKNTALKLVYTCRMDKNDKKTHNDMAVKINTSGDNLFLVGARDIGNKNYADVQFCLNSDKRLTKRMGLIKSKVGFGVDYKWKPNMLYSVDFIDTQNTQVETTSVYKLRDNISIQSKVENALKKKERNYNLGVQYNF